MNAMMTAQLVTGAQVIAIWCRGRPRALLHQLGSWRPVYQRAIPAADVRSVCHPLDAPFGQLLGNYGD